MFGRNSQIFAGGRPASMIKANPTSIPVHQDKIRHDAAIRIQSIIRRHLARRRVKKLVRKIWDRAFDPKRRQYYWYNKRNGLTQWKTPKHCELYRTRDKQAVYLLNRMIRGYLARRYARRLVLERYGRYFDAKLQRFYYLDKLQNKTFWKASKWLMKYNLPLNKEDQALYDSLQKIKELEQKLQQKDQEIKDIRKQRYEELEPLVIADRVNNASKALIRPKDMDRWSIDQLCAWFVQLKMDEYIPFLFQNKVDGNLFVNLLDEDWAHMGITNRFHIRKLQLIMKAFRVRYQRKKEQINIDEEDDLISEYTPSELSEIIDMEDQAAAAGFDNEDDTSEDSYEEEDAAMVRQGGGIRSNMIEDKQQRVLDSQNIRIELLTRGDGENYPVAGDIVRVRYICMLASNRKVVQSTKHGMQKPSVEFVLGIGQIIRGIDRALPKMSLGERSKIFISSEYAYGKEGLFPHIPADADLIFDLTLLGLRSRIPYTKPLIQTLGDVHRPYEISQTMVNVGELATIASGASKSVSVMAEDEDA